MSDTLTLYKLILLYMLDKVSFPMSNGQLSEFMLDKEYTDYFRVQKVLKDLADSGMIRTESTKRTSASSGGRV